MMVCIDEQLLEAIPSNETKQHTPISTKIVTIHLTHIYPKSRKLATNIIYANKLLYMHISWRDKRKKRSDSKSFWYQPTPLFDEARHHGNRK